MAAKRESKSDAAWRREGWGPIIAGMARAFFVERWAQREEEKGRSHGGEELMDVAPATSPKAKAHAKKFAAQVVAANGGRTIRELYNEAQAANRRAGISGRGAEAEFGHYLAMQAMGHGVSWFDDNAKFDLKVPHTEFWGGLARRSRGGLRGFSWR